MSGRMVRMNLFAYTVLGMQDKAACMMLVTIMKVG